MVIGLFKKRSLHLIEILFATENGAELFYMIAHQGKQVSVVGNPLSGK